MKSLLDIQQDVRRLEKSVQEISIDIKTINSDIDELRNPPVSEMLDFDMIELLSRNIQFDRHPLYSLKDGRQCQIYLEMLLSIVRLDVVDQEATINRMVFVQWIQRQASIDWSLEKLYVDSLAYGKEIYHSLADEIPDKYRDSFILDALIVANIAGAANRDMQEYIVDLATILGINAEMMRKLGVVAKASLCQSFVGLPRDLAMELINDHKQYKHYLPPSLFLELEKGLRTIVLNVPDNVHGFKWKVKQYQSVEAGEVIASYALYVRGRYSTKNIKSTVDGTIFQFKDSRKYYGVVSYEKDNKDSIKTWIKKDGKNESDRFTS